MELVLTRHGRHAVERRRIKRGWLRACVYNPDKRGEGKHFGTEVLRKPIDEADGQELVAVVHATRRKILLITAYFEGDEGDQALR